MLKYADHRVIFLSNTGGVLTGGRVRIFWTQPGRARRIRARRPRSTTSLRRGGRPHHLALVPEFGGANGPNGALHGAISTVKIGLFED